MALEYSLYRYIGAEAYTIWVIKRTLRVLELDMKARHHEGTKNGACQCANLGGGLRTVPARCSGGIDSAKFWAENKKLVLPRGSYPNPFLRRLLFKITDPNHKTRYPKKGGRV